MAPQAAGLKRKQAVSDLKRSLILDAARRVFEAEGLDGASLRGIAAEAGYTPAALYFHFASKEAIYAEVLHESIALLRATMEQAVAEIRLPAERLRQAALAFFRFYAERPRDLDLGFYLFRGGMQPKGLGREHDKALNHAFIRALAPIAEAAVALGASEEEARLITVDIFAHASGLLLLAHTGRMRLFSASASRQMETYLAQQIARLEGR